LVVEHTFITTYPADEALRAAADLLACHGFAAKPGAGFPLHAAAQNALEMTRGRANAGRAGSVAELPQQVRLEWDRGRVALAVSVAPPDHWLPGGRATGQPASVKKAAQQQTDLLIVIAESLERLLAGRQRAGEAAAEWDRVEHDLNERARRARRRSYAILAVVVAAFLALILAAIAWGNGR
jgi:hypothetical protein